MAAEPRRPVVHVVPLGIDLELAPGETIIESAWRHGFDWPTICYGQAQCTACHVEVLSGDEHLTPIEGDELDALDHRLSVTGIADPTRIRLACRASATGDVTVRKEGVIGPSGH